MLKRSENLRYSAFEAVPASLWGTKPCESIASIWSDRRGNNRPEFGEATNVSKENHLYAEIAVFLFTEHVIEERRKVLYFYDADDVLIGSCRVDWYERQTQLVKLKLWVSILSRWLSPDVVRGSPVEDDR